MRRIRRAFRAATHSCVLVAGLGGCSVYDDLTTSDFAQQDADAIVAAASTAMRGVDSMRLTGQVRSEGNQYFVDVRLDRDDRCTGSIRLGGGNIDIRRVGDRAWIKGERGVFNRLSRTPLPQSALRALSSSWIPVGDEELLALCDLDSLLALFEVVDYGEEPAKGPGRGKDRAGKDDLDGDVPATVGEESTEDGAKVVELSGEPGGQHEELTWVRTEAPHYVVRVESTSARDGGTLSFTELDQEVEVEVPRAKDVFRA